MKNVKRGQQQQGRQIYLRTKSNNKKKTQKKKKIFSFGRGINAIAIRASFSYIPFT